LGERNIAVLLPPYTERCGVSLPLVIHYTSGAGERERGAKGDFYLDVAYLKQWMES
jgi:hypothetical protein